MGVGARDVDSAEQVHLHVVAVGVFIVRGHADVLVEIEGAATREIQVHRGEPVIDALHRAPGRQAQH